MMSEPKGRGGKKPKYQIADIGGSDLTSEDISTERVLNFLIKGERPSEESGAPPGTADSGVEQEASSAPPSQSTSTIDIATHPDTATSERPAKKDLSHLFERTRSGSGPAKDLKLNLSEPEPVPVPSPPPSQQQAIAKEEVIKAKEKVPVETGLPLQEQTDEARFSVSPEPSPQLTAHGQIEPATTEPQLTGTLPSKQVETSPELAHYVELWKNFYRLKSGEIETLSNMFRMSHDEGQSECYVKMRKLAEMSNLDYRYCQKVVRSLERLGWITKLQDYDATNQLGVLYRVNLKPTQLL